MSLLVPGFSLYLPFLLLIAAFHFDCHPICVMDSLVLLYVSGEIGHLFNVLFGQLSSGFELGQSQFHAPLELGVIGSVLAQSVQNEIGLCLYNHCTGFGNNDCVVT